MYQTEHDGVHHELGTSGFLYRSNKLMYDHATKSFWSTLQGEPVVGPLVGKGIKLEREYLVTTTWGEWKKRHPNTTVLSLETGHHRDYSEGAAYRRYFSTDRLMFSVPENDTRLPNKAEVVSLREEGKALAIHEKFLLEHRVYHDQIGRTPIVILTDDSGGNRVYSSGDIKFDSLEDHVATDKDGNAWKVGEAELKNGSKSLKRVPSHRTFWFGWHAQFPETRLVK